MRAYERMTRTFAEAGLVVPPVPSRFREALIEYGPWHWATRGVEPMEMYALSPYVHTLLDRAVEDHVAVTHAGHGTNSYSLNLGIKAEGLLVAVQRPWGGVYRDEPIETERWGDLMGACIALLEANQAAMGNGIAPGRRLVVVDSDFRRTRVCAWLDADGGGGIRSFASLGRASLDPVREAIQLLGSGTSRE